MSSFNDSNDEIPDVFPNRLENAINVEAFALQERYTNEYELSIVLMNWTVK